MEHSLNRTATKHLQWHGHTDRGKVRPHNEDSFLGLQFDGREVHHLGQHGEGSTRSTDFAFAVSDGMGGARAGEFASRIVVEKITKLLPRSFRRAADDKELRFKDALTALFVETHRALTFLGSSDDECLGMEATLSLCWFTPERMYFGHIGDSRIYHLPAQGGGILQLTQDDTHVGWLLRQGKINEGEARRHPRRKVIQKALGGSNQFVHPQFGAVSYETGDIFLLCTDGLVEGLYDPHLVELLRRPESTRAETNLARRLVDESVAKEGHDNTTALVIQAV